MKTVPCPHCQAPLNAGDMLSQLGRGPKQPFTPEHKARLRQALVVARAALKAKRENDKKRQWLMKSVDAS